MTKRSPVGRKWQMLSSSLRATLALFLAVGCAAVTRLEPPAEDAQTEGKLKIASQLRTALIAQLAAAPHDDMLRCETTAGDCLISLAERRDELVRSHYLNGCRDLDPGRQGRCIAQELEQRGNLADLASYYEMENWCSRTLLVCTASLASDAAHVAARQRIKDRRAEIEAAPRGVAAASAPGFAKEKLAFVRSTMPPKAQEACSPAPPVNCPDPLKVPSSQFEGELAKDPQSYDPERALTLYTTIHQAEADCYAPGLTCMTSLLSQYGATPESEKLLQQNLTLLGRQQQARTHVDPDAAEQCLTTAVVQYSDRIVSAYQGYVRDSAALPLVRLQKAFVGLHEVQLACLTHLSKQSKH